jgi:hypothetical protein
MESHAMFKWKHDKISDHLIAHLGDHLKNSEFACQDDVAN